MMVYLEEGMKIERDKLIRKLLDIQYQRNDYDFHRGTFRVRGDIVEVFPAYEDSSSMRIEFFDDKVESLQEFDPMRGRCIGEWIGWLSTLQVITSPMRLH